MELSKLTELLEKPVQEMTSLEKWSLFLQYAADPDHCEKVNEVIESEEVLNMAGELLMSIGQDEHERARFHSRKKFQTDLQSDLATAEDRGRAEGRAEGRVEGRAEGIDIGKKEVAEKLLKEGFPLAKISDLTGLSEREITQFRSS